MGQLDIAIAGGGIGGMAAAIALSMTGHRVRLYERATAFGRVGADVTLTPNAVHALDGLKISGALHRCAAQPRFHVSRRWDSGEETARVPLSHAADERYGASLLTLHRADLLATLEAALPPETLTLNMPVAGLEQHAEGAALVLVDGTRLAADLVVGADGIHSTIRRELFGPDAPRFTGLVSWRGTVPRDAVAGLPDTDSVTKWWGPTSDRQILTFPLSRDETFVFATTAQQGWTEEGWTLPGDIAELRASYADFHPEARALLDACDRVTRSALHVRAPMERWSAGHATVLGDAAHPMVPFMAQGAGMAIEDAIVLSRALKGVGPRALGPALATYEAARKPRTARMQETSLANDWLRENGDADWVYGYDAWNILLEDGATG